ncbi:MAG: hypothetical protein AAGK14_13450 [Verrucomicrobiota bacterium]
MTDSIRLHRLLFWSGLALLTIGVLGGILLAAPEPAPETPATNAAETVTPVEPAEVAETMTYETAEGLVVVKTRPSETTTATFVYYPPLWTWLCVLAGGILLQVHVLLRLRR